MTFAGLLPRATFVDFVRHRADRLSLAAGIEASVGDRITVRVVGAPDLIDAFEMACSLGPLDCLVREIVRMDEPETSA